MDKILRLIKNNRETTAYLIFGIITVIVNTVLFLTLDLFMNEFVANTIAFILSVLFAYYTNSIYVFRQTLTWKTFIQFFSMRIGTILVDNGGLWLLLGLNCNKLIAKCIVNVAIIGLNYIFSKFFIFKKK